MPDHDRGTGRISTTSSRRRQKLVGQVLRIDGGDAELHGEVYLPAEECAAVPPYPGVVLCHGLTSSSVEVRAAALSLARRGLAAMIFDFRGHGRSGGICDRSQHFDVLDALSHLRELPQVDSSRLAIVGHSSGARAALLAASESPDIAAVVSLSLAPDGMAEAMSGADDSLGGRPGISLSLLAAAPRLLFQAICAGPRQFLQLAVLLTRLPRLRVDWGKTAASWAEWQPARALAAMRPRPVLFVHCAGDWATPPAASVDAYGACPEPKELWLEPGGFHSTPLHSVALRERWSRWLADRLSR